MNGTASTFDNNKNYIQNGGTTAVIDTPETIRKRNVELSHEVINGQLALDQLLASLALESDVTEQHLANLENGNTSVEEYHAKQELNKTNELSAVIATLTEFGASIQNTSEIITNWHLTRANGQIEMMNCNGGLVHNAIKRVHDMSGGIGSSECSSSISPSLSERSTNGVSWSDQVKFCSRPMIPIKNQRLHVRVDKIRHLIRRLLEIVTNRHILCILTPVVSYFCVCHFLLLYIPF